jgi:hypothetical protein
MARMLNGFSRSQPVVASSLTHLMTSPRSIGWPDSDSTVHTASMQRRPSGSGVSPSPRLPGRADQPAGGRRAWPCPGADSHGGTVTQPTDTRRSRGRL